MKKIFIKLSTLLFFLAFVNTNMVAQIADWKIVKPTNTGITGSDVRFGRFDPQGNLWVAARWPFWSEGGVAKYDGIKWTPYSNVDSWMPTDYVNSMAFQPNGVAWIGTDAGLIRFDGTNAQVFNMSNAPFPSNNIYSVKVDGTGNVWFISKDVNTIAHGVIKYDGTNWTVYNSSNSGIPYFDITTIGIDRNNHVWVGTWALGIATFNGTSWTTYNSVNSGFYAGPVTGFAFPEDGSVWVSASQMGIFKFSNNVWHKIPALPDNHDYSTVALHPDGTLWFGTYGGLLVKYDGSFFTPYEYGNHLYSIDFDSLGNVWAGGLSNIKKFVNGVNTLTYNVSNTSLTSYFVNAMDFAQDGRAWFATSMGGACSYDGINWHGFNPNNAGTEPWPFAHNSANYVFIDNQNDNVWVASNGVGYWNGSSWNIFTLFNSNIPDNYVNTIAKDKLGRIWIGTQGMGAGYFDGINWTRLSFGISYTSNTINAIAVAPDSSVWFASNYGLHKTTNGSTYTTYYPTNSGLPGTYINAIAFEPNGTMWVATNAGLAKLSGTTWTVYNYSNSGVPANFISDVVVVSPGNIWVSGFNIQTAPYYGGIAKFNGTTWTTFEYGTSPLTHYQVEKLKLDPLGNLWISTYSEGMMVYKQNVVVPITLLSFSGKKINQFVVLNWQTNYSQNDREFVIERSSGIDAFYPIGAKAVDLNGPGVNSYAYTDHTPLAGDGYYRLKCLDMDGSFTYSKVIKISNKQSAVFTLYPNPATHFIKANYSGMKETVIISIYDAQGKRVQKLETNDKSINIDIARLQDGIYFIELTDGGNILKSQFIKSH